VLDGTPPANTPPIRVDTTPGAIWRYSGGGITVMQQMMIDVTGQPFPQYMQKTVLGPIGMTGSSFEQPQPNARAALTAAGYYADGTPVRGRWHVYPEMAAAGLWTTPTDLAKFAIEVQETLAGRGHGVISPAMARQYVTQQKGGYGEMPEGAPRAEQQTAKTDRASAPFGISLRLGSGLLFREFHPIRTSVVRSRTGKR
jgi:CubicO group peptidase (beta-lactamase class C family)